MQNLVFHIKVHLGIPRNRGTWRTVLEKPVDVWWLPDKASAEQRIHTQVPDTEIQQKQNFFAWTGAWILCHIPIALQGFGKRRPCGNKRFQVPGIDNHTAILSNRATTPSVLTLYSSVLRFWRASVRDLCMVTCN